MNDAAIYKTGYICGLVAFTTIMAYIIIRSMQITGSVNYPYQEQLIYSISTLMALAFLLEILALLYSVPTNKKIWSHAALLFALLYVVFITTSCIVEFTVIIPAKVQGEIQNIPFLKQYTRPIFRFIDAIAYICMGISTFFSHLALHKIGFQHITRILLLIHSCTTPLIMFMCIYPDYSSNLLVLVLPWAVTAPAALLSLAIVFRRKYITEIPNHRYVHKDLN
ncbi:hypothetical protein D3C87_493590 [compost metagenome]